MFSKRIKTIASLVDENSTILDVGTDHGYLPIFLMKNKLIKAAYASDVSENALDIAKVNIKNSKLKIPTILSDGLKDVDVDYDTLIICGMGFNTIKKILESGKLPKTIIIQSNSDHYLLRKYMVDCGYKIEEEVTLKDKKIYYVIIKYIIGTEKLSSTELHYGKSNNSQYFEYKLEKNKTIMKNIPLFKKFKFMKKNFYLKKLLKKNRA
ncbi:MAG: class I SAM-dependent methyltransferase [bacterium]